MRQTVELLPAQGNTRIELSDAALSERAISAHDAVIVVIDQEHADATLKLLPDGAAWQRRYRKASARGPVTLLNAHGGEHGVPVAVALFRRQHAPFDLLALAARAWKVFAGAPPRRLLIASSGPGTARGAAIEATVAAALAGAAAMPVIKSNPVPSTQLELITVSGAGAALDLERTVAIDHGNHVARWLAALPPNVLNSGNYRRAVSTLAKRHGWSFKFFNEPALQRLGAGAFLAVSRANDHRDAGIVRLRYRAKRRKDVRARIALIGKGICFDTGGINLKTHKGMYLMHEDMQGSAVAVGTLLALSELQAPYDIDCWLAITENETGARAFRPQEVVTAVNGVTIQVAHSDAEGRMVLADTLALAARETPQLMLDFATLTGACVTALTERFSGAFANRTEFRAAIEAVGRSSGERVWCFPMDEDFDSDLDSPIADILQCTPDSKGDHILAARFLNRFVPADIPWIHLDLASSNRPGGLAHIPTDVTGFGVRYATHLLLDGDLLALLDGDLLALPKSDSLAARKRTAKGAAAGPTGISVGHKRARSE